MRFMKIEPITPAALAAVLTVPSISAYIAQDGDVIDGAVIARLAAAGPVLGVWRDNELVGAFCFVEVNPATYQIHTNLLPALSRAEKLAAAREAVLWLFAKTMALRVTTMVPAFNRAAQRFAEGSGMRLEYTRNGQFRWRGRDWDCAFLAMGLHDWIWSQAAHFQPEGERFHRQIEAVNAADGLDSHDDDPAHDVMVGACMRLLMAGAPNRGVALFNEWASQAGYAPIARLPDQHGQVVLLLANTVIRVAPDGSVTGG